MDVAQKLDFDAYVMSDSEEINISLTGRTESRSSICDSGMGDTTLDISHEDNLIIHSPRKMEYRGSPEFMDLGNNNNINNPNLMNPGLYSPPYKKVRALRLFDVPASPKSIPHTPLLPRSRLFVHTEKPNHLLSSATKHNLLDKPSANLNPFTPNGLLVASKKRTRSKRSLNGSPPKLIPFPKLNDSMNDSLLDRNNKESDWSDDDNEQPTKKLALHDSNISRYYKEFHEMDLIGTGEFGCVYKCLNRLDGYVYAVKRSHKPVAGSSNEKPSMYEVYAHAVLGQHQNVVRYFSAWAEDDHMIIQNEYCNGGSLADVIAAFDATNAHLAPHEMRRLVLHIAEGLRYIHSMKLVHMDIKPGNIFISRERRAAACGPDSADDDLYDEEEPREDELVTYKIGDLGHVTSLCDPRVEEGDCRYLSNEILHEDYSHLAKADVFALGVTLYEAGGGGPIPKNGAGWHEIRDGRLKNLPHYGADFNALLKQMVDPNPDLRPTASGLLQHRAICPLGNKTKAQLRRELNAERLKVEILSKKLDEAAKCLKQMPTALLNPAMSRPSTRASRLVGNRVNRSLSATNF